MGDSYYKKELLGMPWRFALAMQQSGGILDKILFGINQTSITRKCKKDRCTKAHEYLFLFSKSRKYHFDYKAIKEVCIDGESLKIRDQSGQYLVIQVQKRDTLQHTLKD